MLFRKLVLLSTLFYSYSFGGTGIINQVAAPGSGICIGGGIFEGSSQWDFVFADTTFGNSIVYIINNQSNQIVWQKSFYRIWINSSSIYCLTTSTYANSSYLGFTAQETSASAKTSYIVGYSSTIATQSPAAAKQIVANFTVENKLYQPAKIIYELTSNSKVKIEIYSSDGKLMKLYEFPNQLAGQYSIDWDGKNDKGEQLSSGIYYYLLETKDYRSARKGILLGF
jgi:hypothetical protein